MGNVIVTLILLSIIAAGTYFYISNKGSAQGGPCSVGLDCAGYDVLKIGQPNSVACCKNICSMTNSSGFCPGNSQGSSCTVGLDCQGYDLLKIGQPNTVACCKGVCDLTDSSGSCPSDTSDTSDSSQIKCSDFGSNVFSDSNKCWTCPSSFPNRTIYSITSDKACQNPNCPSGTRDLTTQLCYSCPSSFPNRTINAVTHDKACAKLTDIFLTNATKATFYPTYDKAILVGDTNLSGYTSFRGDYYGNDISCGKYSSFTDLANACTNDGNCKGFNIERSNLKPLCLKNKLENKDTTSDSARNYIFYQKK